AHGPRLALEGADLLVVLDAGREVLLLPAQPLCLPGIEALLDEAQDLLPELLDLRADREVHGGSSRRGGAARRVSPSGSPGVNSPADAGPKPPPPPGRSRGGHRQPPRPDRRARSRPVLRSSPGARRAGLP